MKLAKSGFLLAVVAALITITAVDVEAGLFRRGRAKKASSCSTCAAPAACSSCVAPAPAACPSCQVPAAAPAAAPAPAAN